MKIEQYVSRNDDTVVNENDNNDNNNFDLFKEILRFAKNFLSNGKADLHFNPSLESCLLRIPGSLNGKFLDNRDKRLSGNFRVKVLKRWNGVRAPITREFIEDFKTYLEQKITEQENELENNNNKNNYATDNNNTKNDNNRRIEWIEKLLFWTPVKDGRKKIVELVLAPYLVHIKKLSNEESYEIINRWLQQCDSIRKLDFDIKERVNAAIKNTNKKNIGPMRYITLKERYRDLYFLISRNNIDKNEGSKNIYRGRE
jgi:hypothetical protein